MYKKTACSIILTISLLSSLALAQAEEQKTPRDGRHLLIGVQAGGLMNFRFGPMPNFAIFVGWMATKDLSISYELSAISFLFIPYSEVRHCLSVKYFLFNSLPGIYVEGGAGILTNREISIEGDTVLDDINVPYAFFLRAATGYCFEIAKFAYLGLGLKYHTLFYHAEPKHEINLVLDIMLFLP